MLYPIKQAKLSGRMQLHPWNTYLAPTTVAKWLHNRIDFLFKYLREFSAKLIDPGSLAIVKPGIVKHQPNIIHILPWFLVLPSIQFTLNGWKIHRILHNVKVILQTHRKTFIFKMSTVHNTFNRKTKMFLYFVFAHINIFFNAHSPESLKAGDPQAVWTVETLGPAGTKLRGLAWEPGAAPQAWKLLMKVRKVRKFPSTFPNLLTLLKN